MILSVIFSLFIVNLVTPFIVLFEKRGLSRRESLAVVSGGIIAVIALGFILLVLPSLSRISHMIHDDLPLYRENLSRNLDSVLKRSGEEFPFLQKVDVTGFISKTEARLSGKLEEVKKDILPEAGTILTLTFLITTFLLKESPKLKKWVISLIPNSYFEMSLHLFHQVATQWNQYIRGRILETLALSAITAVLLLPSGLKYVITLSLIAGIANLIPYVGLFVGSVPALMAALMLNLSPGEILYILIVILGIGMAVDKLLLEPFFVLRVANVHRTIILISIIIGGKIMGAVGVILAIPVVSMINIIINEIHAFYKFKGRTGNA